MRVRRPQVGRAPPIRAPGVRGPVPALRGPHRDGRLVAAASVGDPAPMRIDTRPLQPTATGTIPLGAPDDRGRRFVSAASGIAAGGNGTAWVVSDEMGALVRIDARGIGHLEPGLPPTKHRPDFESMLAAPSDDAAHGATMVFAAGSGSKDSRHRGVVQDISAAGAPVGAPRMIDLGELHARMATELPGGVNVEGMALHTARSGASELVLLQREQDGDAPNRLFRVDGPSVLAALRDGAAIPARALLGSVPVDLGSLHGVRLGFADATALPDGRIAFAASAEAADGSILGSAIGMLDRDLRVTALRPLAGAPRKIEGIELASRIDPTAAPTAFVLVTDPDDADRATERLTVDLA